MSFNTRIKERREQLHLTRSELADKIGVTQSAISNYENAISSPKIELLYKLFDALKCDANYLYQDEMQVLTYTNTATPDEFEKLVKPYRSLDSHGQQTVDIILDRETERVKQLQQTKNPLGNPTATIIEIQPQPVANVRLTEYFHSASAGGGVFILGNEPAEKISVPATPENEIVDYVIKVAGDSMEPDYHDGDNVMVSQRVEMRHGDVGIFVVNGKAYIKEYGETELISRNPDSPNIKIAEFDNIVCMGKVIGRLEEPYEIISN